jgi:hypothetical protein
LRFNIYLTFFIWYSSFCGVPLQKIKTQRVMKSSIDSIEVGMTVFYGGDRYTVSQNTGESVVLKGNFNKTVKVPFYSCNNIKNEEGVCF